MPTQMHLTGFELAIITSPLATFGYVLSSETVCKPLSMAMVASITLALIACWIVFGLETSATFLLLSGMALSFAFVCVLTSG